MSSAKDGRKARFATLFGPAPSGVWPRARGARIRSESAAREVFEQWRSSAAGRRAGGIARPEGGGGRRKSCQYCRDKVEFVDYKDITALKKFVSDRGKIRSRRITGACRRHQNQIARAVKRARELALLPYVGEGSGADEREGGRGGRGRDRDR